MYADLTNEVLPYFLPRFVFYLVATSRAFFCSIVVKTKNPEKLQRSDIYGVIVRMSKSALKISFLLCLLCIFVVTLTESQKYKPTWESIDSRPIPEWYDDAKIGMFITWGVYSVPSMSSEWFWWFWKGQPQSYIVDFMKKYYPPKWTYADFAKDFRAEFYNPKKWRDIIVSSGAK